MTTGDGNRDLQTSWGAMKRLLGYIGRYRIRLAAAVFLMLVYSASMAVLPALMGYTTDLITEKAPLDALRTATHLIILNGVILWLSGHASGRLLAALTQQTLFDLRTELFSHMQGLSLSFFDRQPIGELMSRVSNDTDLIDQFYSFGFQQVIQSVLTIVMITVVMLWISPLFTFVVYIAVFALLALSGMIARVSGPAFERVQELLSELNGYAEERLTGQKLVVACRQQERTTAEFAERSLNLANTGGKAQFVALTSVPASTITSNLQTVLLLVIGGAFVIHGDINLGILVAFLGFSSSISGPLSQIFSQYALLIGAATGAARVFTILDEEPEVADRPDATVMPPVTGDVRFDDVTFSYIPGRTVLKNNSFHALPGQIFGLCGPTGAGKSTIINILTRYYDIDSGSITVDGEGIDGIRQDSLRIQIAQVLQEPFLFSGTILENLRYAREGATDEECYAAAKQAGAEEFILSQPDGYGTVLVDGGINLSQGQRQILTIARAMVARPRLLILDEATSNVDTRTEKLIQAGLLALQNEKTSFIIAHRLSTIRHADCILVITEGRIIEQGTHDELLAKNGFYHSLYMSQFRGKAA